VLLRSFRHSEISEAAIYWWKKRFDGMEVLEGRRMKLLELENSQPNNIMTQQNEYLLQYGVRI